ncbi:MAG: hypothetical protein IIB95_10835 [Candidatus Marinimicrobia bacterium]|nr:hypothetical protein [Candidatus Neomarinimicrobiota bacterium]
MLSAQVSFHGNTETRIGESKNGFYYNETLLNTHLQYGDFVNWFQFEFSDPPELGNSVNGLRKLRLEYSRKGFDIKLGDIYEIWGRGLVLNSMDDQSIDRDTGIRGLSLRYNSNPWNIHFITGQSNIRLSTPTNPSTRKHDYTTFQNMVGVNLEYKLNNHLFGSSFIQSKEKHAVNLFSAIPDTVNLKNQLMSIKYIYNHSFFDLYAEYIKNQSFKYDEVNNIFRNHADGRGFYSNLNLYLDKFSLNFEYINYRLGILNPGDRTNFVDNYGLFQPFQNPPIAMNINEHVLLNRVLHQTDFNNEVGFKIELMSVLTDWVEFLGIYSVSSRSHSWVMDSNFQWNKVGDSAILPLTDLAATPFRDLVGEVTFNVMDQKLYIKTGYSHSYDVTKLDFYMKTDTSSSLYYSLQKSRSIPLDISYTFDNGWSINAKIETQFYTKGVGQIETLNGVTVVDTFRSSFYNDNNGNGILETEEFLDYETNRFTSIGIGKSPLWSVALTWDNTNVSETILGVNTFENPLEQLLGLDQTRNWVNIEFVYNITSSIRLSLLYGSLRGGLICANGICRIIEPFNDGFKLGLTSLF